MKEFKLIDIWVSIVLIIGFSIYSLIKFDHSFLIGYFVVGGWQVISMIVHAAQKWFTGKDGPRYVYNWITFIALITFPIGSYWILLFIAPCMAIYYTWQCYYELYILMRRPLDQLK